MSQYWAGYRNAGMVLEEKEFNAFLEKYKEVHSDDQDVQSQIEALDNGNTPIDEIKFFTSDAVYDDTDATFRIEKIGEDTCEGPYFVPFRMNGQTNVACQGERKFGTLYFIPAAYDLCAPTVFEKQPYSSYDSFLREMDGKADCYLPNNFDWDAHIGVLSYACFA